MRKFDWVFVVLGLALLVVGHVWGLFIAPVEREMGEVYRIMFVHVPAAWMTLLAFTTNFIFSVAYLLKGKMEHDLVADACAEVGLVFNGLCLVTGSIWGRPTWGVYWSWDPRLTTVAILFVAFAGYLLLRRMVEEREKRATWSAVTGILIAIDIPLVWFSVKWWNSLHQLQSSPQTVSPSMYWPLRIASFAFLFIMLAFIRLRYLSLRNEWQAEERSLDALLGEARV